MTYSWVPCSGCILNFYKICYCCQAEGAGKGNEWRKEISPNLSCLFKENKLNIPNPIQLFVFFRHMFLSIVRHGIVSMWLWNKLFNWISINVGSFSVFVQFNLPALKKKKKSYFVLYDNRLKFSCFVSLFGGFFWLISVTFFFFFLLIASKFVW